MKPTADDRPIRSNGRTAAALITALALLAGLPALALSDAGSPDRTAPDPSDPVTQAALEEAQLRQAKQEAYWKSPAAKLARERSRSAYRGKNSAESLSLAHSKFPGWLDSPVGAGLPLADGQEIARYVDDYSAELVGPGKHRAAVRAFLPLRARNGNGEKAPVDMRLDDGGDRYAPKNALVPVELPKRSGGQVRFLAQNFGIRLVSDSDREATLTHDRAWFGGIATDTDAAIVPAQTGVLFAYLLRSPAASERQELAFELPPGSRLRIVPEDGSLTAAQTVEIVAASGKSVAHVDVPAAWDAQGQTVPVRYELLENDRLAIEVSHQSGDFEYPIAVDPLVSTWSGAIGTSWPTYTNSPDLFPDAFNGYGRWRGQSTAPWPYEANRIGYYSYHSHPGTYLYMVRLTGIYHYPNNSNEYGGIYYPQHGYWAPGSWQDDTSNGSGPGGQGTTALRFQSGEERVVYTSYCAGQSNPASCNSSNPPPAKGTVAADNLIAQGIWMNGPTSYPGWVPQTNVYNAYLYESDDLVPSLAAPSHSGLPSGWSTWFSASVNLSASVSSGLGMGTITLNGPGVSRSASTSCTSYPCQFSQSASFSYSSTSMPEGTSTLTAQATNKGGNQSNTRSWQVKIDRTMPSITPGGTAWNAPNNTLSGGQTYTITGSATDAHSGVGRIVISATPEGGSRQTLASQARSSCPGGGDGCAWTASATYDTTQCRSSTKPDRPVVLLIESQDIAGNPYSSRQKTVYCRNAEQENTDQAVEDALIAALGAVADAQCATGQPSDPNSERGGPVCQAVGTGLEAVADAKSLVEGEAACVQTQLADADPTAGGAACQMVGTALETAGDTAAQVTEIVTDAAAAAQEEADCAEAQIADPDPARDGGDACKALGTGLEAAGDAKRMVEDEIACVQAQLANPGPNAGGAACQTVGTALETAGDTAALVTEIVTDAAAAAQEEVDCAEAQLADPDPAREGGDACQAVGAVLETLLPHPSELEVSSTCTSPLATVADGYAGGSTFVRLRVQRDPGDPNTTWVCYRISNGGSLELGGRFDVTAASPPTAAPEVEDDPSRCQTEAGNTVPHLEPGQPLVSGFAGPVSYAIDAYAASGTAWLCLDLTDGGQNSVKRRVVVPVPGVSAPDVLVLQDPPNPPLPDPPAPPFGYASATCSSGTVGAAQEHLNAAVGDAHVWAYSAVPSATRAYVCARVQGPVRVGGMLTVDATGSPGVTVITPEVSTTDMSGCTVPLAGTTAPVVTHLSTSAPGANPAYVCVTAGTERRRIKTGTTGTPVVPSGTWTKDPDSSL